MTETTPTIDQGLAEVVRVLTDIMRTATRPDVLEAQRVLLQRLAYEGDVFPSRVPPPLNITEVGGYLNLLAEIGLTDTRSSAIASALGIAGPPPSSTGIAGHTAVGFVEFVNDRPAGSAQFSITPLIWVRADFASSLRAALATLHGQGCALPLRAVPPGLPSAEPGAQAPLEHDDLLGILGRTLEVFPGTVLFDPVADPLAIARPDSVGGEPLRLVARQLDDSGTVPEASWVALRADVDSAQEDLPADARFVDVEPIMVAAGWHHPEPVEVPISLPDRGSLVRFVNRTGLIAGETTLGEELAGLYTAGEVARSALAGHTHATWDGAAFTT